MLLYLLARWHSSTPAFNLENEDIVWVVFGLALMALVWVLLKALGRRVEKPSPRRRTPRKKRAPRTRRPTPRNWKGWTLVVDGSNLSYRREKGRENEVPRLRYLLEVCDALEEAFPGATLKVICDASLRHQFGESDPEDQRRFERLVEHALSPFSQVNAGTNADVEILTYAREHRRCIVVSNDTFSKHEKGVDERALRVGVPLLKVRLRPRTGAERSGSANVELDERVDIYRRSNSTQARRVLLAWLPSVVSEDEAQAS